MIEFQKKELAELRIGALTLGCLAGERGAIVPGQSREFLRKEKGRAQYITLYG